MMRARPSLAAAACLLALTASPTSAQTASVQLRLSNMRPAEVSVYVGAADGSNTRLVGSVKAGTTSQIQVSTGDNVTLFSGQEPFQNYTVTAEPTQSLSIAGGPAGVAGGPAGQAAPAAAPAAIPSAPPAKTPEAPPVALPQPVAADPPASPPPAQKPLDVMGPPDASGLRWQFSGLPDPAKGPRGQLVFGVPETDGTQIVATCTAAKPEITLEASGPVDGFTNGQRVEVLVRGDGYEGRLPGAMVVPRRGGESLSGVRVRLDPADGFWAALMDARTMTYAYGRAAIPLPLAGSKAVVGAFLGHCRGLAPGQSGATPHNTAAQGAASCKKAGSLRSAEGASKVDVVLVNRTGEFRNVEWIDRAGKPVSMGALESGGTLPLSIWEGQPYMLSDGPGNCIEVIRPSAAGGSRIELRLKSPGFGEE